MRLHLALIAVSMLPTAAYSTGESGHRHPSERSAAAPASAELSEGEVRRIDKDAQKMTIKHGEINNLNMPPMTMVFRVKDPALLERVKAGDKIRFRAERIGGAYTVTTLESAK